MGARPLPNSYRHVDPKIKPHSFYLFEFEQNVRNIADVIYPEYPTRRKNEEGFSLVEI